MQTCNHCGWSIPDNTPVCPYCWYPLELTDEERRRRLMLRWNLNMLLLPMGAPSRSFLLSSASSAPGVNRHPIQTALVFLTTIITVAALIAGLVTLQHWNSGHPPLLPMLTPVSSIVPGGPLSVHGSNFATGGSITLTVDGHPTTIANAASSHQAPRPLYPPVSLSLLDSSAARFSEGAIPVMSDGTFDATIISDVRWSIGSTHELIAIEESFGLTALLSLVVPQPASLSGCSTSTSSITLVLGPVDKGQKQSVSATFKLCTIGSGLLHWSASWNQQQAHWLQLDSSGQILAPISKQLTVIASSDELQAGIHSTTVTFSSQGSNVKVFLNVMFIIRVHTETCLNTTPRSLAFTATQGKNDPAPQTATITNCGNDGAWTATTHTDDGADWLHISPVGGYLKGEATQNIIITVSKAKRLPGTYTGQIIFKIGSSIAALNITLTVQQAQPCITTHPQFLTFTAVQGQNPPKSQITTLVNCGNDGTWSTSISTMGAANWLSINLPQGYLKVNTSQDIFIGVSSTALPIGSYTGRVTFKLGSSTQIVIVTLTVLQQRKEKPCLTVNPHELSFTSSQGLGNPSPQGITLMNCGPAGSWSATVSNGANWLNINPSQSSLDASATRDVSVNVSTTNLDEGSYTGEITFTMTSSGEASTVTVKVILTVQPPSPCIQVNPTSLTFTQEQASRDVTVINCGDAGSVQADASTEEDSPWLGVALKNRQLHAGATEKASVSVNGSGLAAGKYTGTVTIKITTATRSKSVAVSVTFNVPGKACIQANPGSLSFPPSSPSVGILSQSQVVFASQSIPQSSQTVTLTNCGDAGTLQAIVSTVSGGTWLDVLDAPETLNAGTTGTAAIRIDGAHAPPPGTYHGAVTFTIVTLSGTQSSKTVQVTLAIPAMQLSKTTLNFDTGCTPLSQSITVSNVGGGTLTWVAGIPSASWVTVGGNTSASPGNPATLTFTANPADL